MIYFMRQRNGRGGSGSGESIKQTMDEYENRGIYAVYTKAQLRISVCEFICCLGFSDGIATI